MLFYVLLMIIRVSEDEFLEALRCKISDWIYKHTWFFPVEGNITWSRGKNHCRAINLYKVEPFSIFFEEELQFIFCHSEQGHIFRAAGEGVKYAARWTGLWTGTQDVTLIETSDHERCFIDLTLIHTLFCSAWSQEAGKFKSCVSATKCALITQTHDYVSVERWIVYVPMLIAWWLYCYFSVAVSSVSPGFKSFIVSLDIFCIH